MDEILKISNRGACPRLMLEIFGATNKRERISDHTIIGVNGTGTKCAPVAAFRLNIGVAVTSVDETGPYYVRYLARKETLGGTAFQRLVMTYGPDALVPMPCFTTAARNWDAPIGSDSMKTYRVLREYLTNAKDEDAGMIVERIKRADVRQAAPGSTTVFLTWHPDFDEVLYRNPERYFKWLSTVKPVFSLPGVGAIYPKSDPDHTRIFCQGTLAACIKQETNGSLFDWSTDDKNRLSEDREFRELTATYADFHRMLRQVQDLGLAARILSGALSNENGIEFHALVAPVPWPADGAFPARDVWRAAWFKVCQSDQAIISSGNREYDETARYSYGKKIMTVSSSGLRLFLKQCGIQESKDFVPQIDPRTAYKEVEADAEEKARLAYVLGELSLEYAFPKALEFYMYEPRTVAAAKQLALTHFDDVGEPTRVGFQRGIVRGPLEGLVKSALHELVHVLVPTAKHESEFIDHEGRDRARLFMQKRGIPTGLPLDPPSPPPPEGKSSPETEAALKLVKRMSKKK